MFYQVKATGEVVLLVDQKGPIATVRLASPAQRPERDRIELRLAGDLFHFGEENPTAELDEQELVRLKVF